MLKLNFKKTKILSAVLVLSTFGTIANVPNVSAVKRNSFKIKPSSFTEKIKSETKKFKKEHPKLLNAGIGIGGAILGVGIHALGNKIAQELLIGIGGTIPGADTYAPHGNRSSQEVYLRDVPTVVDNMSDKQIQAKLKNQIKIFKNRDRSVFVIENELIKKAHPRLLLIILMKINNLFEKYPVFTKKLIETKKFKNATFSLGLIGETHLNDYNGVEKYLRALAVTNVKGVYFNGFFLSHFKISLALGKMGTDSKFNPPVEPNQMIERLITHEMGHVLQFLIAEINFRKIYSGTQDYSRIYTEVAKEVATNMKKGIMEIVKEKYSHESEIISRYGETNAFEWFAEAFAHMECCNNPNPIGLATKDYINNLFSKDLIF